MSSRVTTVMTAGASSMLSLVLVAVDTCTLSNLTKSRSSDPDFCASCARAPRATAAEEAKTHKVKSSRFIAHSQAEAHAFWARRHGRPKTKTEFGLNRPRPLSRFSKLRSSVVGRSRSVRAADSEAVEVRVVVVELLRRNHVETGVEAVVVDHLVLQDRLGGVLAQGLEAVQHVWSHIPHIVLALCVRDLDESRAHVGDGLRFEVESGNRHVVASLAQGFGRDGAAVSVGEH